jgi:hypothetical protein
MEAAYFNPRPIHVAMLKCQSGPATKVFRRIWDTGYQGLTIVYDPGSDQLKGIYSQNASSRFRRLFRSNEITDSLLNP